MTLTAEERAKQNSLIARLIPPNCIVISQRLYNFLSNVQDLVSLPEMIEIAQQHNMNLTDEIEAIEWLNANSTGWKVHKLNYLKLRDSRPDSDPIRLETLWERDGPVLEITGWIQG